MTDRVIYIRGVPDELHHYLTVAAATNRRSLNEEVIFRLCASRTHTDVGTAEPQPATGVHTATLTRKPR